MKEKLEIIQEKLSPTRTDSFWYDGRIARIGNYYLVAAGEVKVSFTQDGETWSHEQAMEEADSLELQDKDINKLFDEGLFYMNNWFEVIYDDGENYDSVMGDVSSDYDEGINMLKQYWEDKVYQDNLSEDSK